MQGAGWSSGCVYCRRYLLGYFMPSSSTWVNFRSAPWSGLEEPGRVTTRALLREPCEKSSPGMHRAPQLSFGSVTGWRKTSVPLTCEKSKEVTHCIQWWSTLFLFLFPQKTINILTSRIISDFHRTILCASCCKSYRKITPM